MARRLARHPVLCLVALGVLMLVGSVYVSSTVEVLLVGTSWLGLDSAAGVCFSVAGTIVSLVGIAFLLFVALRTDDGDDDDGRGGDDGPPTPEGPSEDPDWWPGFEREFAAYLHEPEGTRRGDETPVVAGNSTG